MKRLAVILLHVIGLLIIALSATWCYFDFSVTPVVTCLTAIFGYGAFLVKKKPSDIGVGGHAISSGENTDMELENNGQVIGGKGGSGGCGGDAIHVNEGLKITIVNHGTIKGGDAGN